MESKEVKCSVAVIWLLTLVIVVSCLVASLVLGMFPAKIIANGAIFAYGVIVEATLKKGKCIIAFAIILGVIDILIYIW